jgi:hypothetical protein
MGKRLRFATAAKEQRGNICDGRTEGREAACARDSKGFGEIKEEVIVDVNIDRRSPFPYSFQISIAYRGRRQAGALKAELFNLEGETMTSIVSFANECPFAGDSSAPLNGVAFRIIPSISPRF